MTKFLTSVWCTLIVAIALGTIFFFATGKIFNGGESTIVSLSVTIIIFLVTQKLIVEREMTKNKKIEDDNINREFKLRPTFDYVDRGDERVVNMLKEHIRVSAEANDVLMKYLGSMDEKLNSIINKI